MPVLLPSKPYFLIKHERVMLTPPGTLRSGRRTEVEWEGKTSDNEDERWKRYPIDDGDIFWLSETSSSLRSHRQYEARLQLREIGIAGGVAFAAFAELETDPLLDKHGKFNRRVELGRLGNAQAPIWLRIGDSRAQARKDLRQLDGSLNLDLQATSTEPAAAADTEALKKESLEELERRLAQAFQAKLTSPEYVKMKSRRGPCGEAEIRRKSGRSSLFAQRWPANFGHRAGIRPLKIPLVCADAPKNRWRVCRGRVEFGTRAVDGSGSKQDRAEMLSNGRRLLLACDVQERRQPGDGPFRFISIPTFHD